MGEEGERAQRLGEEVGSRRIQAEGKESRHRTALPGLLWPGVPRGGWTGLACLVLGELGVHLRGPWKGKKKGDTGSKEACCFGEQIC